jgi:predicted nucleotidyltransferase component of viral defense system
MKLHLDRPAFGLIIDEISKQNNIRRDVLEKDYYVTLLLKELSEMDNQGYAYFKGGTALYKALKSIRRFSEDIDLTVFIENCSSPNQKQKKA